MSQRQSSLHKFWTTPNSNRNNNRTNGSITEEQRAKIAENKRKANERLQRTKERLKKAKQQQLKSKLTPAMNKMSVHTPSNNNNNNNNSNIRRNILANTTNTTHNSNNNNNGVRKSNRKRSRVQYNDEYSDASPEQVRKKRRTLKKKNNSDDDFDPNDFNFNEASDDDDYTSPSVSPVKLIRKKKRIISDDDGDLFMNNNVNDDSDDDDDDLMNNNNNKSFNALTDDPSGSKTLNRISAFKAIQIDSDDEKVDNSKNRLKNNIRRDDQYKYTSYNDYIKKSSARLNGKAKGGSKAGGASHKDVSQDNWYKNPTDHAGVSHKDPNSNKLQILIPASAYKKMTKNQVVFWKLKSTHYDGMLFFKVGKFYELYCEDAHIGNKYCGLSYIHKDGQSPHTGFPEKSFDKFAETFIQYGYKIYRVEQTQTAANAKKNKNKLVRRELCGVYSKGTVIPDELIPSADANYILSIVEEDNDNNNHHNDQKYISSINVGICYIDFSTGNIFVGNFIDDRNRSRLRTLIYQINPTEIIYPRNKLSMQTLSLLKQDAKQSDSKGLIPDEHFFSYQKTVSIISESNYFSKDGNFQKYPAILRKYWKNELIINAFGGILYMLQHTLHDQEILPHSIWDVYDPTSINSNNYLTLDGSTLGNLEILINNDGTLTGTLLEYINKVNTKFGYRLLVNWLKKPLNKIGMIKKRLDAVTYLVNDDEWWDNGVMDIRSQLKELPDLDRLLHNLAVLGTKDRMMDQAVMFDACFDKKKVNKLIRVINGLESVAKILNNIQNYRKNINSKYINDLTSIINNSNNNNNNNNNDTRIPEYTSILNEFKESFDFKSASEDNIVKPTAGRNREYDECVELLNDNEDKLFGELDFINKKYKKKFNFWHAKKNKLLEKYLIEVPRKTRFQAPMQWIPKSSTKSVERFHTPKIINLLKKREKLVDLKEKLLRDAARAAFARFAENSLIWKRVCQNIAELDCLLSLAQVSKYDENMTQPEFINAPDPDNDNELPFLEIRNGRHPCINDNQLNQMGQQSGASTFIPNDTVMGCSENLSNFVIVTGPNMGGKSTLLRQTCILVILAHIGCYVTADKMKLTPVDRIFTRVGANDRILAGQSTFMVELEETSNILSSSTKNSLVILDELGRGTSTFDGTAIAFAVAKEIINNKKCRCLFSTHYHGITESFVNNKHVSMYHMAYKEGSSNNKLITFLYKFTPGICKQSHGINCAKLAGLEQGILDKAKLKSKQLHDSMHQNNDNNNDNQDNPNNHQLTKEQQNSLIFNFKQLIKNINDDTHFEKYSNISG